MSLTANHLIIFLCCSQLKCYGISNKQEILTVRCNEKDKHSVLGPFWLFNQLQLCSTHGLIWPLLSRTSKHDKWAAKRFTLPTLSRQHTCFKLGTQYLNITPSCQLSLPAVPKNNKINQS